MSQKIVFEKIQNFEENTTEYRSLHVLPENKLNQVEEEIYQRYTENADYADKVERMSQDSGRLQLKVKTNPESIVYSQLNGGTAFIVQCEDFDIKWHVSNILQISLALAGFEIKDTKF